MVLKLVNYERKGKKCFAKSTTLANRLKSEHLITSLRLAFIGAANTIMNPFLVDLQGIGIKFIHQAMMMFHPKWPRSLHITKKIGFYEFFCHPDTNITVYSAKFKALQKVLLYNGISYPQDKICNQFINNLGVELTNICNKYPLPQEWQCQDIDKLILVARQYISR